jgi:hypothetical protein
METLVHRAPPIWNLSLLLRYNFYLPRRRAQQPYVCQIASREITRNHKLVMYTMGRKNHQLYGRFSKFVNQHATRAVLI